MIFIPVQIILYLLAAKYIFKDSQVSGMVSKLSGTTKNITAGLMSDPQKMENLISMVRTVVPLTSVQTVSKVNTYLPIFEKASTLLGMYSFLNRAQNFRPIEPLNTKNPQDIVSAFMKNGNLPIAKLIAQPLITNNMDKMFGAMATNMLKNGGLNELLKNENINEMLGNENLSEIFSSLNKNNTKNTSENKNIDLNSLMETFMPLISSLSSNSSSNNNTDEYEHESDSPKKIELMNESNLPYDIDEAKSIDHEGLDDEFNYDEQYDKYDRYDKDKKERYDRNYKKERFDNYEKAVNYNDHKNNFTENRDTQKPIRIKQRKRR